MRNITLQYIPALILPLIYSKHQGEQGVIFNPGIILIRLFLHLRVEREFLFGLFLLRQIRKFTLSQPLTKICKPYPTHSTCALVKNGGIASKTNMGREHPQTGNQTFSSHQRPRLKGIGGMCS